MASYLVIVAIIIFACIYLNKVSGKIGIPTLLVFIGIGMVFGNINSINTQFINYELAETICSISLIFIMFYGGFGTNWKEAKKAAPKAILLSTVGVLLTAFAVALFCHLVLKFGLIESLILGSVMSATDAASVFSILRSKKLNLKYNTSSLLEIESGSNDPMAYMLTAVFIAVYKGQASGGAIFYMVFAQIVYGFAIGIGMAFAAAYIIKKINKIDEGFFMILIVGIAIAAYAVPTLIGGNGYLSVYIVGIVLGNKKLANKVSLVHFFDGITTFTQMLIFFILGLLSSISVFPQVIIPALVIAAFLVLVARPLVVGVILAPFKCKFNQMALVSFAGLRGASSIVFAITVVISTITEHDIYHIAFIIVLLSIFFQGTFLPQVAKKLKMIDEEGNYLKTFNDYVDEVPVQFIQFNVPDGHEWVSKQLKDIVLPPETLAVLIRRENGDVVPNGSTVIEKEDRIIISARSLENVDGIVLTEIIVEKDDEYDNRQLRQISLENNGLVIMVKRGEEVLIPDGTMEINEGDILVVNYPSC